MKYLIFIILLFSPVFVFGQDLIVTTAGDSLKCKIVEVKSSEIQFRFGTGGIVTIERNQVASYQYNFAPTSPATPTKKAEPVKKEVATKSPKEPKEKKPSSENSPFYAAFAVGASSYGSYSLAKVNSGGAFLVGADVAYFFSPWLGAGLKLSMSSCEVDFSESFTFKETVTFAGPALYGRWGNETVTFTAGAGAGMLKWKLSNLSDNTGVSKEKDAASYTTAGGILSAGVSYMLAQNLGVGLNVQSVLGSAKDKGDNERKPAGIGATLGINFRF